MPALKVCIAIDDHGGISVGAEPPDGDQDDMAAGQDPGMTDLAQPPAAEAAESDYMKPAKSIDEALSIARDLLRNAGQVGAAVIGGEPGGPGAQSSADAAFAARRPPKPGVM